MARIRLDDATNEQLAEFVENTLQIDVADRTNRASMLSIVADIHGHDWIEAEAAPEALQKRGRGRPKSASVDPKAKPATVRVMINPEEHGIDPVPISVNGVAYSVRRGEEVDLPYPYFEALKNAKRGVPIVDKERTIIGYREVPAFPYQVLRAD